MPPSDLQQRGLAGAVGAHQPDAIMGRDKPVEIFEQELWAEAFSGRGELDHGQRASWLFFWLRMIRSSMGLRPAKPSVVPCQCVIPFSPSFQHSRMTSSPTMHGKSRRPDIEVFHLHAGGIDFGDGIFRALDCLLALGLAAREGHHVNLGAAIDEDRGCAATRIRRPLLR